MAKVIDAILTLRDNFSATMDRATKSMERMAKQMQRTGRDIQQTGKTLNHIGDTLTKSVTLPIVGAGAAVIKFSMDLSDAMAKVSTVMDETQVSISEMRKQVLELSNATGVAVTDITEGLYDTISAGIQTKDAIKFLEVAVKSAKGGFTDTKTAVDGLTTTLNSYGLAADQVSKIANQMMVAQNLGKTTFGEMAAVIGNVTPLAASLGIKTQELFSSLATLTANGIQTSEAVTGLKAAFSNIIKPSKEAADAAEALGIDFSASAVKSKGWLGFLQDVKTKLAQAAPEYVKAVEQQNKLKATIDQLEKSHSKNSGTLKQLKTQYKDVTATVKALEGANRGNLEAFATMFGSVEGLNSVLALTSEQGIKLYNESMRQMGDNTDYVGKAFDKVAGSPGEKMRRALNQLKNSASQFGDVMVPVVDKVSSTLSKLADIMSKMSPQQREMAVKFALIAASIGPVVKVIGTLTQGIGTGIRLFGSFAKNVKMSGSIMQALLTPGGRIALVIAAIAVAIILLIKYWGPISTFFKNLWQSFKQTLGITSQTGQTFSKVFEGIRKVVATTVGILVAIFKTLAPIIGTVFAIIIGIVALGVKGIVKLIGIVINVIAKIASFLAPIFEPIAGFIKKLINGVIDLINKLIRAMNKLHWKIPDWIPIMGGKEFGFNIPEIPKLAKGAVSFEGGPAIVGEKGPELVYLPRQTRVLPAEKTQQVLNGDTRQKNVSIVINMNGTVIREDADIEKLASALARKISETSLAYGGAW